MTVFTKSNAWWICALGLMTLWGGILRFYDLGAQSFWLDEAVSVLHARAILEHGYPLLANGRVSWESFPAHYAMALGMIIFPGVHLGARFFSALAGTLLIPALFVFVRQTFKAVYPALIAACFLTFMTYEIAWSRQARMYVYLQLSGVLAVYYFYLFLERRRVVALVGALIFATLGIYCHRAGYLVIPVFILAGLGSWAGIRGLFQWAGRHLRLVLLFLLVIVLISVPLFVVRSTFSIRATLENVLAGNSMNYAGQYLAFLWSQMNSLLFMAAFGALAASVRYFRWVFPLIAASLLFLLVISFRTPLFAFRYSLPIHCYLLALAGYGIYAAVDWFWKYGRAARIAALLIAAMLFISGFAQYEFNIKPRGRYMLGVTEPQPEWRDAYALIAERHQDMRRGKGADDALCVVSAFPMFHDIYLDMERSVKYFLPISFTGYPGELQINPPYTTAFVIKNLDELLSINGYVILDDFGLRMLLNKEIRGYLSGKKPSAIIPGPFNVYIWLLGNERRANTQGE